MILADLNLAPRLFLAVRSAIDVGSWADCAALVAEATASAPPATCFVHAGLGAELTWCLRTVSASTPSVVLAWWATLAYPHIKPRCGDLHKRTKQRLSTVKAQTGRGQDRLKTQRRRATAPSAHEGAQNHRTSRPLKLARQAEDLVRQFHRHAALVGDLSVVPGSMSRLWENEAILRRTAERSVLGCCEAASFPIP